MSKAKILIPRKKLLRRALLVGAGGALIAGRKKIIRPAEAASSTILNLATRSPIDGTESVALATAGANWKATLFNILVAQSIALIPQTSWFVNFSTGADGNDGKTSGTAWATMQHAYSVVSSYYFNNQNITINVADGTYAPGSGTFGLIFQNGWVGGGTLTINGDTATPDNCVVSTTNADCFNLNAQIPGTVTIQGFKLTTTTAGSCITIQGSSGRGSLNFNNIDFGACAGNHLAAQNSGASISSGGQPYTISGNATNHYLCNSQGFLVLNSSTVTVTGTPAFTIFAQSTRLSFLDAESVTFSGAGGVTGQRFEADLNSVIFTGSGANPTYFPGNSAGTTATGGQYQ